MDNFNCVPEVFQTASEPDLIISLGIGRNNVIRALEEDYSINKDTRI